LRGLQVTEPEVEAYARLARVLVAERLVDLDRARVQAEAKVDDAEQVLPLGVARLERQRVLELLLGLVDAIVLDQLAPAVKVEQEILVRHVAAGLSGGRLRGDPRLGGRGLAGHRTDGIPAKP